VDVVDLILEDHQDLVLAVELVISQCQIHRHKVKHLILELVEKETMAVMVLDQELVDAGFTVSQPFAASEWRQKEWCALEALRIRPDECSG